MTDSNRSAWYLAQLIAGLSPANYNPDSLAGVYADAYRVFASGNGRGPKMLQSWLAQPGREQIRMAVFAHTPGAPMPPLDARNDHRLTDMGNAERLADQHHGYLRFVREWDWMHYDQGKWSRNPAAAVRCAKRTVRRIYAEAEAIEDDRRRKEIVAWGLKSEANTRIDAMLKLAQSETQLANKPTDFDSDPMLLNCKNGVLDLRTGKLREHTAADLHTRMVNANYNPKAQCPHWLRFLDLIFEGNKDVITYVQTTLGYSLTGDTSEQVLFFCYGSGRNGKSTLLETMRYLMGDYGQQAEASTFLTRNADSIRNDVARLAGVRFAAAIEVGEGRRLNETLVKQVTGQDTITARFLHREYFEFVPAFKLWMAANHKPIIRGTDEAIWRRIRLIPFNVTIPAKDVDKRLKQKLMDEIDGIFAFCVRGVMRWNEHGLHTPKAVIEATREYRSEMDVIAAFIDECCVIEEDARVGAGELYRAYKQWAEANNETVENQRSFGMRMTERNFEHDKSTNGVRIYRGIGLIDRNRHEE